ncbi:MAG: hypothetical protein KAI93_11980, partial [Desulfobacterales bacterium]|nr:hypothetical protein [Desulfobacterales bacterium]
TLWLDDFKLEKLQSADFDPQNKYNPQISQITPVESPKGGPQSGIQLGRRRLTQIKKINKKVQLKAQS